MKYNLVSSDDRSNITIVHEGEMYVADSSHVNFDSILAKVLADDTSVVDLFDPAKVVAEKFEKVSERVTILGGKVYFDGDEVDNSLTRQILRFMEEGLEDWKPLVNFYEKVASNPKKHSRKQLFTWLEDRDFTITLDGNIIGYKALFAADDGLYKSQGSGRATVNGVAHTGQIPQKLGDLVEMPRSDVQHDPSQGCHTGLHFGTWDYALDFAAGRGVIVTVEVNPRDIVSVPTDCDAQKVRTCRYKLLTVVQAASQSAVWEDKIAEDCDCGCQETEVNYYCEICGEETKDNSPLCEDCDSDSVEED